MTRTFGARAPSREIARKLLHEIVRPQFPSAYASVEYEPAGKLFNHAENWHAAIEGIDTAIVFWWFCDEEFVRSVEHHHAWADWRRREIGEVWLGDPTCNEKMGNSNVPLRRPR